MAERLGNGLQNHVHRFESGSDLTKNLKRKFGVFSFLISYIYDKIVNKLACLIKYIYLHNTVNN